MNRAVTAPSLLPKPAKLPIAVALFAAVFLEGSMLASIGPTLDALADQTGATTEAIAFLFTANSLGYLGGSLLAGRLYTRVRGTVIMAAALAGMALFTASIPMLGTLPLLAAAFAAVGIGLGLVDVGGNTMIVWLYRKDVPPYMNALHLAFGVGAFLCPLIVDRFAVVAGDAAAAFWLYAALMVPVALWVLRVPSPDAPEETASHAAGTAVVRKYAVFVGLMSLLFVMHVGGELAFGGWIFSYAEELGIGADTTSRVLNSVFWGGLVLGRVMAIPVSLRMSPRAMLWASLLGCGASLGLIAVLPDWSPALWLGTAGFGISIAPVFATCINYAGERMPITSQVTSWFVVGGGIGSMSLPWLVGQLFDRRGPESMIWVVGGAVVAGSVLYVLLQIEAARMARAADVPAA